MSEPLDDILADMKKCADDDIGAGMHIDADSLLVKTIRILATEKSQKDMVEKIIQIYEGLAKWYE